MTNDADVAPGDRFGDLTVMRSAGAAPGYGWVCRCDAGHQVVTYSGKLRNGSAYCRECAGEAPPIRMRRVPSG